MVEFINAPQLIKLVKRNIILYDKSMRSPKNAAIKEKIWLDIATKLRVSVESVKHRWKTLRDKYVREHKLKNRSWRYYHNLTFLSKPSTERSSQPDELDYSEVEETAEELFKVEQLPYEVESEDNSDNEDNAGSRFNQNVDYLDSSDKGNPLSTDVFHKHFPKKYQTSVDISSVIKAATEHIKATTPVHAFFHSLALQVEEFGLPFSFFSRLQIKIIEDLQDIITEYESTKL